MHASFGSQSSEFLQLRRGTVRIPGRPAIDTPNLFPIIDIITGPPPIFANGGLFRHIKELLLRDQRLDGFMTEILHFTEFSVSRQALDRWLSAPIHEQLEQYAHYKPVILLDSGGYRLLFNSTLRIDGYGLQATPEGILDLQLRFGGDILATLDYPLLPDLPDAETQWRVKRTTRNAVKALELARKRSLDDRMFFLAVHGRNRGEAKANTRKLLSSVKTKGLTDQPFGVAIGSLVPLSSAPQRALPIVIGVSEAVREFDPSGAIPIHAFGISATMAPFLALLGVDSFDGSAYVQSAQNLKFVVPGTLSQLSFLDMNETQCRCKWCQLIAEGGLQRAQEILRGRSYQSHEFNGVMTNKSYIYALIALHNFQAQTEQISELKRIAFGTGNLSELLLHWTRSPKMWQLARLLMTMHPDLLRAAEDAGVRNPQPRDHLQRNIPLPLVAQAPRTLAHGPEAFSVFRRSYRPRNPSFFLFLPCTHRRPYGDSSWHRKIRSVLRGIGIVGSDFEKVTLSGNFGPVPERYEKTPIVLSYDYHLQRADSDRIELLAGRTKKFVLNFRTNDTPVIAYCTSVAYRNVFEKAFEELPETYLVPHTLKARRSAEFMKESNLAQLRDLLKELRLSGAG